MNSHLLTNARIVTPTENFIGSIEIENGLITAILKKTYANGTNLHGQWLIPGCIDIHTDYLEKELHPRPEADFSLPFALHYLDARAANCGITTVFSAISFSSNTFKQRDFDESILMAREFDAVRNTMLVRHFLHARIDPNSNLLLHYLDDLCQLESLYMVVYNEDIPGERQYRLDDLVVKRAKLQGISEEESRAKIMAQIEESRQINNRGVIQKTFGAKSILGSHDDTTIDHVIEAKHFGATLSEMPTTLVAAQKAKELGMWVCMGAPNYYRGGSHCGNLSCVEAISHGLVDVLCSDYHFPTMLGSVVRMIQEGFDPSIAINLVTINPARLLQFDRELGSIEVGKRADLVSFEISGSHASVRNTYVDGVLKNRAHYELLKEITPTSSKMSLIDQ
jgi:alpha-D-ribose 1-methylphosphonate 5-triphosphate diphosphatase